MNYTDISIDLETLGKHVGCPIMSIGVVPFNRHSDMVNKTSGKHIKLKWDEQLKNGFKPEASTISWWVSQDNNKNKEELFQNDGLTLEKALLELNSFLPQNVEDMCLWSVGNDFDVAMLRYLYHYVSSYSKFDINYPFKYNAARDVRTFCEEFGFNRKEFHIDGLVEHNDLDDAIHAARCVQQVFRLML